MKVNGSFQNNYIKTYQRSQEAAANLNRNRSGEDSVRSDSIEISPAAKKIAELTETAKTVDVRDAQRIEALREKVASGDYRIRAYEIASSMLEGRNDE